MTWLNIFNNPTLLIAAETLLIITGSMLMGIWLSYLYYGGLKKKNGALEELLKAERLKSEGLKADMQKMNDDARQREEQLLEFREKANQQAKALYNSQQYIFSIEEDHKKQKESADRLAVTNESLHQRLRVIEEELRQVTAQGKRVTKPAAALAARANYEHVSMLLGRQVSENDLTVIAGIGPKTALLLHQQGIDTWEKLSDASISDMKKWLEEAGGIYKTHDPSHWPRQAKMAARGEWRKLRIYQEKLKKG